MGWYTVYTFLGALAPDGIMPAAKFTLHQSLAFSCIGIVTARHSSNGRQPNFVAWYMEWNYGKKDECVQFTTNVRNGVLSHKCVCVLVPGSMLLHK